MRKLSFKRLHCHLYEEIEMINTLKLKAIYSEKYHLIDMKPTI